MRHFAVQEILDECLLDDDEFELGVDGWKATMGDCFLHGDMKEDSSEDEMEEEK
jgi:hypothetical protein